jgi:hypothetical protein
LFIYVNRHLTYLTLLFSTMQHKDMAHFDQYIKSTGMDVQMEYLGDRQLLAFQVKNPHLPAFLYSSHCLILFNIIFSFSFSPSHLKPQGKAAAGIAAKLAPHLDFPKMMFMNSVETTFAGIPDCRITRCGYTGEDGFEISVPYNRAVELAK